MTRELLVGFEMSTSEKSFDSVNGLLAGACGPRGGEESSSNGFPESSKGLLTELVLLGGAEGGGGGADAAAVLEFLCAGWVAAAADVVEVVVVAEVDANGTDFGIIEKPLLPAAGFSAFTPPCFSKSWIR